MNRNSDQYVLHIFTTEYLVINIFVGAFKDVSSSEESLEIYDA